MCITDVKQQLSSYEMGDRLATIDKDRNVGAAAPLSVGGGAAGSPSKRISPAPRPTSVPSGILIHPIVWPQYTNVTDTQADNIPVAQDEPLLVTVAQKRSNNNEKR